MMPESHNGASPIRDKQAATTVSRLLISLTGLVFVIAILGVLTTEPTLANSQTLTIINKENTKSVTYVLLSNDQVYKIQPAFGRHFKIGDEVTLKRMNNEQLELCRRHECNGHDPIVTHFHG